MKKSGRKITLITLFILCAVFTAILFLTVPKARLEETVFWIAFAFAIPFNLLCAVLLHLWSGRKDGEDIVDLPLAYVLIGVFGLIYLVVGAIFMYVDITKPLVLIIIEIVVTAAYVISAMYFTFAARHITDTQRQTKQKVLFIKLLKSDVDALIEKAQGEELKNALKAFSENVRFSDPMSHASLAGIENELSTIVREIGARILENEEDALTLVKIAEETLKIRNERCIILK